MNLTETLNSLEGAGGMEGDKYVLLHYFFFISILQNLLGGMEGEREIKLTETLNSLEEAGGMEEDKYVLLYYF